MTIKQRQAERVWKHFATIICDWESCHLRCIIGSCRNKGDFHKPFTKWTKNNRNINAKSYVPMVGSIPAIKGLEYLKVEENPSQLDLTRQVLIRTASLIASVNDLHLGTFIHDKCIASLTEILEPNQPKSILLSYPSKTFKKKRHCHRVSSVRYTGLGSKSTGSWRKVMSWAMGLREKIIDCSDSRYCIHWSQNI